MSSCLDLPKTVVPMCPRDPSHTLNPQDVRGWSPEMIQQMLEREGDNCFHCRQEAHAAEMAQGLSEERSETARRDRTDAGLWGGM